MLALLLSEVCLHAAGYKLWIRTEPGQFPDSAPKNAWYEPHPEFGWVYSRKNSSHKEARQNGTEITYQANQDGFRDSAWSSFDPSDGQTTKILVFGDSQAAGYGVREEDRFSNILQSLLGSKYRVYNFSVAGWGFDQMFLAYQKFLPIVKPQIVIFAYINNDLLRSLESYRASEKLSKPSFEVENNQLRLRVRDNRETIGEWIIEHVYLVNFFYKNLVKPYMAKKLNEEIAEEIIAYAKDRNIKVIFIRIPAKDAVLSASSLGERFTQFQRDLYNRVYGITSFLNKSAPAYVSIRDLMREKMSDGSVDFYFPTDPHLNPKGHRFVAEALFKEIQKY